MWLFLFVSKLFVKSGGRGGSLESRLEKKRTITTKCDLELDEEKLKFIHKYHLLV